MAFEVCQQLVLRGRKAIVIMLDTVCPKGTQHLSLGKHKVPAKHVMGELHLDLNDFYQKELENNEKLLNNYNAQGHCRLHCTAGTSGMRVVLFKARSLDGTSRALKGLEDLQNGWGWLSPEIYSVAGSHFTMCEPAYAGRCAGTIRFVLGTDAVEVASLEDLWFHAVRHGDTFLYSRLLKHPEFSSDWINSSCRDRGLTALQIAAANDDVYLLKILLEKRAELSGGGKSAMQVALDAECFRTFSFLSQDSPSLALEFGDSDNKRQLEMSCGPLTGAEIRGQPWLRTLKAMNDSSQGSANAIDDLDAWQPLCRDV